MTEDFRCAFSDTLKKGDFTCIHAKSVVRRGGNEIACQGEKEHNRCAELFEKLKLATLAELNLEDDLTSVPHSVLVKVQFGGLLGLQSKYRPSEADSSRVEDVDQLISTAIENAGGLDGIPYGEFVSGITEYRLPRRGRG